MNRATPAGPSRGEAAPGAGAAVLGEGRRVEPPGVPGQQPQRGHHAQLVRAGRRRARGRLEAPRVGAESERGRAAVRQPPPRAAPASAPGSSARRRARPRRRRRTSASRRTAPPACRARPHAGRSSPACAATPPGRPAGQARRPAGPRRRRPAATARRARSRPTQAPPTATGPCRRCTGARTGSARSRSRGIRAPRAAPGCAPGACISTRPEALRKRTPPASSTPAPVAPSPPSWRPATSPKGVSAPASEVEGAGELQPEPQPGHVRPEAVERPLAAVGRKRREARIAGQRHRQRIARGEPPAAPGEAERKREVARVADPLAAAGEPALERRLAAPGAEGGPQLASVPGVVVQVREHAREVHAQLALAARRVRVIARCKAVLAAGVEDRQGDAREPAFGEGAVHAEVEDVRVPVERGAVVLAAVERERVGTAPQRPGARRARVRAVLRAGPPGGARRRGWRAPGRPTPRRGARRRRGRARRRRG